MNRLYIKIYALLLGVLVLSVLVAMVLWHVFRGPPRAPQALKQAVKAALLADLPPVGDKDFPERLLKRAQALDVGVILRDHRGHVIVRSGPERFGPPMGRGHRRPRHRPHRMHIPLPPDHELVILFKRKPFDAPWAFVRVFLIVALLMALGAWPLSRRLGKSLSSLSETAKRWGDGDLRARADNVGDDEVGQVARRFNEAADKIEALVAERERVLASASHEFRAPLTRLRMALELGSEAALSPKVYEGAAADIDELDSLVGDLLAYARGRGRRLTPVETDFGGLVSDEAERLGLSVEVPSMTVKVDAPLCRRAVRNLLHNAMQHGRPPVRVRLERRDDGAVVLSVKDSGPGLAGIIHQPQERTEADAFGRVADGRSQKLRGGVPQGTSHEVFRERSTDVRQSGAGDGRTKVGELSGLSPEVMAQVFEPFFRAKGHHEGHHGGVGLGLALVKEVAQAHGGEVSVRNHPEGGAEFLWVLGES